MARRYNRRLTAAQNSLQAVRKLVPARPLVALECFLVFVLAVALVKPLFKAKYLDRWSSIESTFIADARFLSAHWPHPGWQPLWYCGTRFDYVYPPALRYGSAFVSRTLGVIPAKGYHIYCAFFYAVGIAGVYFFVVTGSGSRGAAWLAAAASALVSPNFLFIKSLRDDAWLLVPQRLGVLVRYGEGPHMTALALIPIALAFTFRALPRFRPGATAAAAFVCALVVSNNFYGATALAILFALAAWSVYLAGLDKAVWVRAGVIAALAYGLAAFWLTPSYLWITVRNLKFVSEHGNAWSLWIGIAIAIVFLLVSDRYARGRREAAYAVFVTGSLLFFSMNVLGYYALDFRIVGEPARHVPEFDLAFILAAAELLRRLWKTRRPALRIACAALVCVSFFSARDYVRRAWHIYIRDDAYQNTVEYKMAAWVAANFPDARTFASGSVRFWFNAWFDLQQVGGGSEQGLSNPQVIPAQWQVRLAEQGETSVEWLRAMGADLVIVHEENSKERYHDFRNPKKFQGRLPVIFNDGEGNLVYRVPRRAGLARVVETARARALLPPRNNEDLERVRAYAEAAEGGPDVPASTRWEGTDRMRVRARLRPGESILVQESYDPAWRAWSAGRSLPVVEDALGFMRIEAPPGEHDIALAFETPLENRLGRVLTFVAGAICAGLAALALRRAAL